MEGAVNHVDSLQLIIPDLFEFSAPVLFPFVPLVAKTLRLPDCALCAGLRPISLHAVMIGNEVPGLVLAQAGFLFGGRIASAYSQTWSADSKYLS